MILALLWCTATAQFTIPPVSPPKCVAGCDDESTTTQPQPRPQRAPVESPAQRAAREAAAEEARRRAEAEDRAASEAADASRDVLDRLEQRGARLRDVGQRFETFEREASRRARVPSDLRDAMAPVKPATPPAPFSLDEYIRRLNEEERARQRGLRSTPPPPLGTVAPTSTRPDPPTISADRVGVQTGLARQLAEVRAVADELAWEVLWHGPEKFMRGLKPLRSLIEDGKKLFEGLNAWNLKTLEGGFSQASQVVELGRSATSRPSITGEDNTALLEERERDMTRTSNEFFSDKFRSAFLGGVVEHGDDWASRP